jgi:hypothetical protein
MADPYDPEQRELLRRQDQNWRALPIVLGAIFLFALGFLLLSDTTNPPGRSGSIDTTDQRPQ